MELIGRIVLIATLVASPWAFGSVTPEPLWFLCLALGGLLIWRLVESIFDSSGQPLHLPVALLAPLGLLLIASMQLLPRDEGIVSGMEHAVFGEWADELQIDGSKTGTISPVTTRTQTAKLFFAMGAFLLSSVWFATPQSQKWLWAVLALNGAVLGFFGIIQRLTWNGMLFWRVPLRFGGTPFASFVNRNNAAGFLNLCLAAGLGWLLLSLGSHYARVGSVEASVLRSSANQSGSRRQRNRLPLKTRFLSFVAGLEGPEVGVLGLITVMGAAVMFSLSRGGILAGLMGPLLALLMIQVTSRRQGRRGSLWGMLGIVILAGGATVGLLMWLESWGLIKERLASLGDPFAAAQGRLQHWWDTLGAVLDFPLFGTGLGTYRYANLPYQAHVSDAWYVNADNHFVEMLVETGSLGFVCYVSGFVLTGLAAIFLLKQEDISMRATGVVGLCAILSQTVQAVTDFGLLIPSNGLTFAVMCGAVCGMACSVADFEQIRVSKWLSLVKMNGRVGKVLLSLILVVTAGLFELEMYVARLASEARNPVFVILPHKPLDTPIAQIEQAIETGAQALRLRPDDAELHRAVAQWWIDRYRLQAFREIRDSLGEQSKTPATQIWRSTSLPVLHERVTALKESGDENRLASIRSLPVVSSNLVPAYRHLHEAIQLNPLMRSAPNSLAYLTVLQNPAELNSDPDELIETLLKVALFIGPSTPDELLKTGVLADALGHVELSQRALSRSLALSEKHLEAVWSVLISQASVHELLAGVIPNRLDVILALAELTNDVEVQQELTKRGAELANGVKIADSDEFSCILLARLAELQGEPAKAIEAYRRAVRLAPEEIEPRLMLARVLQRNGQLEEAEGEYSVLILLAPNRRDISKELRELRLMMTAE
ncbi:MAG: O-antigen ligase family protein [Planctomycetaceae bacterium]|nr:O-antigen ligase family protein [Planctomycetaceae bacterium]